jgi:hypothetical protein
MLIAGVTLPNVPEGPRNLKLSPAYPDSDIAFDFDTNSASASVR